MVDNTNPDYGHHNWLKSFTYTGDTEEDPTEKEIRKLAQKNAWRFGKLWTIAAVAVDGLQEIDEIGKANASRHAEAAYNQIVPITPIEEAEHNMEAAEARIVADIKDIVEQAEEIDFFTIV